MQFICMYLPISICFVGGDNVEGDSLLEIVDLSSNDPEIVAMTFEE